MKVTFVPIVIGALGTVTGGLIKGLEYLEIRGRVHYGDREESWRLEETCCRSNSNKRPSANTDVENSQGEIKKVKLATIVEGDPKVPFFNCYYIEE